MRSLYFICVFIAAVVLPWWLFFFVAAAYAFAFYAPELVLVGVVLDALLGTASHAIWIVPFPVFYTVILAVIVGAATAIRPLLSFHKNEIW